MRRKKDKVVLREVAARPELVVKKSDQTLHDYSVEALPTVN